MSNRRVPAARRAFFVSCLIARAVVPRNEEFTAEMARILGIECASLEVKLSRLRRLLSYDDRARLARLSHVQREVTKAEWTELLKRLADLKALTEPARVREYKEAARNRPAAQVAEAWAALNPSTSDKAVARKSA